MRTYQLIATATVLCLLGLLRRTTDQVEAMRAEAVDHGAAEWVVDSRSGGRVFRWVNHPGLSTRRTLPLTE